MYCKQREWLWGQVNKGVVIQSVEWLWGQEQQERVWRFNPWRQVLPEDGGTEVIVGTDVFLFREMAVVLDSMWIRSLLRWYDVTAPHSVLAPLNHFIMFAISMPPLYHKPMILKYK